MGSMERGGREGAESFRVLLDINLSDRNKADILLVAIGEKPAARDQFIWPANASALERAYQLEEVSKLECFLRRHGVAFKRVHEIDIEDGFEFELFYMGKNEESLERLLEAERLPSGNKKAASIGRALGYPDTAIEGFISGRKFKLTELPGAEEDPEVKFFPFQPSRDHWREEVEYAKRAAAIIREKLPELYRKIVSESGE